MENQIPEQPKKKRGRPAGSKNKVKQSLPEEGTQEETGEKKEEEST